MASFDTALINGATYTGTNVAALASLSGSAFINNGNGTFTLDGSSYGGAFSDFYTGCGGTCAAPSDVASVLLHAYNPTLAPGIVTYTEIDGAGGALPGGTIGGEVIGWTAHSVLIEQIPNFVATDPSAGQWAGNLNPSYALWLSDSNISFEANGGNGPTFPVTFGTSGPFSVSGGVPVGVPEPATYALMAVALLAVTVVRLPWLRRIFGCAI
jgi:hypothetical protein